MRYPKWVTAQDLDRWAATLQAKGTLPELVRRLVWATVPQEHLLKVDFPSEAEIHRPGYDGTTVTRKGTIFVPEGVGFWELGCDVNDPKGKAQRDYDTRVSEHNQRSEDGEHEDLSQATFVAVTARRLPASRELG